MKDEIEVEYFSKCPKCGHEPEDKSICKNKTVAPVYNYVCASCGYKESGTASMPVDELIKSINKNEK